MKLLNKKVIVTCGQHAKHIGVVVAINKKSGYLLLDNLDVVTKSSKQGDPSKEEGEQVGFRKMPKKLHHSNVKII
jgi:ribosomal protein L24